MQRYRDPDEAVVMQRCSDKAMECPGLDHPGQNQTRSPKQGDSNNRCNENRRPGLEHPGRIMQQEPPAPDWIIQGQTAA